MTPLIQAVRAMNYREFQRLMGRAEPPRLPWSPLRYPNRRVFSEIREAIEVDALGKKCARPAWELYSSVVGRNASHFAPFSWYRWQAFHLKARELIKRSAAASGEERDQLRRTAQIYAGYADHFLQDSFAAGHLINKTLIMQWYIEWLLKSRLPLADRALLAPMTREQQPMLHGPDLYYPEPGGDGQRLYPLREHRPAGRHRPADGDRGRNAGGTHQGQRDNRGHPGGPSGGIRADIWPCSAAASPSYRPESCTPTSTRTR